MHARIIRRAFRSAAIAAAVTGTLTWAPSATAQSTEPTPSSQAPTENSPPEAGSIVITKKDPAGDVLTGAEFLLLDAAGHEAGRGKTDTQGKLTFPDLAPGVYRLTETTSGSPIHDVVADQDVIVTPGGTARLTITDPFKAAQLILKAADDKTGKLLPGSTVNIGTGDTTLLTLTTGPKGTASGELPISSRMGNFWFQQIKAPHGYSIYKPKKTFTATPGAPITVTVTNTKTGTHPRPDPSGKPTSTPSTPEDKPSEESSGGSSPAPAKSSTPESGSSTLTPVSPEDDATPTKPTSKGSLASTGADATPWIIGGAGLLVTGGIAAVLASRRRPSAAPLPTDADETS
ncbi:SpaA isopeptide-forming pilin-related protein [Streptomyces anulatus]|uniref:SpaA isopeptide-forming pilin-related protein n=1 Tax=Streptomyces anulatus TaxID=1892 RepID=UPI0033CCA115